MYEYPFGNGQQLNLDWFLAEWKNLLAAWEAEKNGIEGALQAEIDKAEAALADVFAARDAAAQSATNALESKNAAAQSASDASGYLATVRADANTASNAAQNAAQSESNAAESAQTALASKNTAANSERNAAQSEANALTSKNAAAQSAADALAHKDAAAQSAADALANKDAAAQSAEDAREAAESVEASAQQITTNANDISKLKESINLDNIVVITGTETHSKAILYSTGKESNAPNNIFITNYVPILPNTKLVLNKTLGSSTYANCLYGIDKTLKAKYYANEANKEITVPSDCYYARFTLIDSFIDSFAVTMEKFASNAIIEIVDLEENKATKDGAVAGYFNEFNYSAHNWAQQGIGADGAILNITNAASLFKTTPYKFAEAFRFVSKVNTNQIFTIIRYTESNGAYVWQEGTTINEEGVYDFPQGYYKFSFRDNTSPAVDYYNMSADERNAAVNAKYQIFENLVAGERFLQLQNKIDDTKFKKPFVICSFDWYSDSWQKYQIMHEIYGLNASFCLDYQTSKYDLTQELTRTQFDTMLENGWDFTLYGCGNSAQPSEQTSEAWQAGIASLIAQKEAIGIFNPVMYNTPQNSNSSNITQACKNLGFLLQRAFNSDTANYLVSTKQFNTGCRYLTNDTLTTCKSAVETAIQNNCGVVFYAHNMGATTDLSSATFTEFCEYLANKVSNGEIEVLSAREYAYKYLPMKAKQNDYQGSIKMFNYLHGEISS